MDVSRVSLTTRRCWVESEVVAMRNRYVRHGRVGRRFYEVRLSGLNTTEQICNFCLS